MRWIRKFAVGIMVCLVFSLASAQATLQGFNSKWSYMPPPEDANYEIFIGHIKTLRPQVIRYPGGTLTHKWNWQTGTLSSGIRNNMFYNPITNLTTLVKRTGTEVVFVLDVVHSTLSNQMAMLKASKLPIKYIELGNETYDGEYKTLFPDGKAYAEYVNNWIPTLRKEFPEAKLSASLLGRQPTYARHMDWNTLVEQHIGNVDAFTYHIYVKMGIAVTNRIAEFEAQLVPLNGKELWVTEYGIQEDTVLDAAGQQRFIQKLHELRTYVEMKADIAMCHILTTKNTTPAGANYSVINYGGATLSPVGEYFKTLRTPSSISLQLDEAPTGDTIDLNWTHPIRVLYRLSHSTNLQQWAVVQDWSTNHAFHSIIPNAQPNHFFRLETR